MSSHKLKNTAIFFLLLLFATMAIATPPSNTYPFDEDCEDCEEDYEDHEKKAPPCPPHRKGCGPPKKAPWWKQNARKKSKSPPPPMIWWIRAPPGFGHPYQDHEEKAPPSGSRKWPWNRAPHSGAKPPKKAPLLKRNMWRNKSKSPPRPADIYERHPGLLTLK
ncbi:hypothetical protein CASFOL_029968 [Castilleja foliolosa]|uniref:Proline-rich protein n=1 Tax=Castilleja foliolosa TaxID=1961234 RepID=A0ABD3CAM1_9LAMI